MRRASLGSWRPDRRSPIADGHCHYLGGAAEGPRRDPLGAGRARRARGRRDQGDGVGRDADAGQRPARRAVLRRGPATGRRPRARGRAARARPRPLRPGAWHARRRRRRRHRALHLPDRGRDLRTSPDAARRRALPPGSSSTRRIGWNRATIKTDARSMPAQLRLLIERLGLDPDTMLVARGRAGLRLTLRRTASGSSRALDAGIGGASAHGDGVWRSVVGADGPRASPSRTRWRRRRRPPPTCCGLACGHRAAAAGPRCRPARRRRRPTRRPRRPRAAGRRVRAGRGGAAPASGELGTVSPPETVSGSPLPCRNRSPPRVAAWLRRRTRVPPGRRGPPSHRCSRWSCWRSRGVGTPAP